jgi:hypothetical protein
MNKNKKRFTYSYDVTMSGTWTVEADDEAEAEFLFSKVPMRRLIEGANDRIAGVDNVELVEEEE